MAAKNRYSAIIEAIFHGRRESGSDTVDFSRDHITRAARSLGIETPRNLGDVIYTFRYRQPLPASIRTTAPAGMTWIIRPAGTGRYRFVLVTDIPLAPNPNLAVTKIPDATPGMVSKYAFSDEQAVLARVRYNRLVDLFLGIACYSLQNHLRTAVRGMGQVETDEIYVGVDKRGIHYVIPVQAKSGSNMIGRVQIEQDIAVCGDKLAPMVCRPVGAYSMQDGVVALLEFEEDESDIRVANERHYRLVPPESLTAEDLAGYRQRLIGGLGTRGGPSFSSESVLPGSTLSPLSIPLSRGAP